jgi:hypothetical protein
MKAMKLFVFLTGIFFLTASADGCDKKKTNVVYKGRLEIKAICMNYTIKLMEGNIDTSLIAGIWTDETTNKSYTNVFALASPCTFPSSIKQGDEFYFTIDTTGRRDCAVCMAYYPRPSRRLSIKVQEK